MCAANIHLYSLCGKTDAHFSAASWGSGWHFIGMLVLFHELNTHSFDMNTNYCSELIRSSEKKLTCHPMCPTRPIVCSAGASTSQFFFPTLFCFYFPFLCFSLSCSISLSLHIPSPSPFTFLVLPCFFSLASWWSLPRDLFALLANCALWLPPGRCCPSPSATCPQ